MDFDFDHLASLDGSDFEFERARILQAHIKSLPEDRRKKAYAFQLELDLKREELGQNQFLGYCFERMAENMENVADQFNVIRSLIAEPAVDPTRNTGAPRRA